MVKTREGLLKLLTTPEKEVFDVLSVSEDLLYANWRYKKDAVESAPNTNVVLAAYTTEQARVEIYSHIEKLSASRVHYLDTDSCIFKCNEKDPTEYRPCLGTLLGNIMDELKSYEEGAYIINFLSGGPKFYAFRALVPSSGKTVECCKVKRISLNTAYSRKINFDSIERLIAEFFDNEESAPIVLKYNANIYTCTHRVVTRSEKKSCSIFLRTRRYFHNDVSLPFSYKRS